MDETPLVVAPRGRDAVGNGPALAAVLVTTVVFGLFGTPMASVVGLVPAVALVLGGPLLAFISGTVALVGVSGVVGLAPVPAHLALASFLLAAAYDDHGTSVAGLYLAAVAATVGTFVATRAAFDGLVAPTAILAGGVVVVSYGLHRYELLTLGLIDE